jgi:hypothetical protein
MCPDALHEQAAAFHCPAPPPQIAVFPFSPTRDEGLFLAVTELRNSHFRTVCDAQYCAGRTALCPTRRLLLVINFVGCMLSVCA